MLRLTEFILYGFLTLCFLFSAWHLWTDPLMCTQAMRHWTHGQNSTKQLSRVLERLDNLEAQQKRLENQLAVIKKAQYRAMFEQIGSRFFYIENQVNQDLHTAKDTCRQMGGSLASFQNEKELDAVMAKLDRKKMYWLVINFNYKRLVFEATNKPITPLGLEDYKLPCYGFVYKDKIIITNPYNQVNFICQADFS